MEPNVPQLDADHLALRRQRVLIVGGGAIGQVFGHYLQEAGAEIAYFLKPRHAAEAEEGYDLHRYGLSGLRPRRTVKGFDVFTDPRMLRARTFDQIWLCVPSPALREEMIPRIHESCPDAVWVSFQPGVGDIEYLKWRFQTTKVVAGVVTFVAYQAPLEGEDLWPEGIAYFVPPWSMTPFTGPEPYVSIIANLLQKGGLSAGVRPDTTEISRFGSAILIPFVMALEALGWSWTDLRKSDALMKLVIEALTDIHNAVEKASGRTSGYFSIAQKAWAWKMALFAVPSLASFPIENYFRYHFSKVRPQTDQMADELAQLCRDNAIVPRALESLRDQWRSRRAPIDGDAAYQDPAPGRDHGEPTPVPLVRGTGMLPAVLPAPIVVDEEEEELTPGLDRLPSPIEVDLSDDDAPLVLSTSAHEHGLDEITGDGIDPAALLADAIAPAPVGGATPIAGVAAVVPLAPIGAVAPLPAPIVVEEDEELDYEGDTGTDLEPPPKAPILRSLADLDQIPAIKGPEADDEPPAKPPTKPLGKLKSPPKLPPKPPAKRLPFDVEELVEAKPEVPLVELPSIMIDHEQLTDEVPRDVQPTLPDAGTVPAEVHFRDDISDGKKSGLNRQDFIQTDLANEAQNASLRDLKARLKSRMKPGLSPGLKSDEES